MFLSFYWFGVIASLSSPFFMTWGFIIWENCWLGSSFALNLFKCTTASVLFLIISLINRIPNSNDYSYKNILMLIISSIIGIFIGDNFWLASLKIIGARRVIIVDCIKPLFAFILGLFIFDERITLLAFIGIIVTITGVLIVSLEKTKAKFNKKDTNKDNIGDISVANIDVNKEKVYKEIDIENNQQDMTYTEDIIIKDIKINMNKDLDDIELTSELMIKGYFFAFCNVFLDIYGAVLTRQYGSDLTTFEISFIRFGFAALLMIFVSVSIMLCNKYKYKYKLIQQDVDDKDIQLNDIKIIENIDNNNNNNNNNNNVTSIEALSKLATRSILIIDLRDMHEVEAGKGGPPNKIEETNLIKVINCPLNVDEISQKMHTTTLEEFISKLKINNGIDLLDGSIKKNDVIITHCGSGGRGDKAAGLLIEAGFINVYNGGSLNHISQAFELFNNNNNNNNNNEPEFIEVIEYKGTNKIVHKIEIVNKNIVLNKVVDDIKIELNYDDDKNKAEIEYLNDNDKNWYLLPNMNKKNWLLTSVGVLIVTFTCPALFNFALFHIELGLCLTLTSLGPIYSIPLVYIIQNEKVSQRSILGAILAFTGIAILCL